MTTLVRINRNIWDASIFHNINIENNNESLLKVIKIIKNEDNVYGLILDDIKETINKHTEDIDSENNDEYIKSDKEDEINDEDEMSYEDEKSDDEEKLKIVKEVNKNQTKKNDIYEKIYKIKTNNIKEYFEELNNIKNGLYEYKELNEIYENKRQFENFSESTIITYIGGFLVNNKKSYIYGTIINEVKNEIKNDEKLYFKFCVCNKDGLVTPKITTFYIERTDVNYDNFSKLAKKGEFNHVVVDMRPAKIPKSCLSYSVDYPDSYVKNVLTSGSLTKNFEDIDKSFFDEKDMDDDEIPYLIKLIKGYGLNIEKIVYRN